MKIDFIPFQIGMQYEHWELDLESVNSGFNLPLDKYIYFKKDITQLFTLEVQQIYLYFTWDTLFKVEVILKTRNPVQEFIHLATQLEKKYGNQVLSSNEDLTILQKTWKDPVKKLTIEHHFRANTVSLFLTQNKYLGQT